MYRFAKHLGDMTMAILFAILFSTPSIAQNQSAHFNGAGDTGFYVPNIGLTSNYSPSTFTAACWIKRGPFTTDTQFIIQDSSIFGMYLINDTVIAAYIGQGSSGYPLLLYITDTLHYDNKWHHIAMTYYFHGIGYNAALNLNVDNTNVTVNPITAYFDTNQPFDYTGKMSIGAGTIDSFHSYPWTTPLVPRVSNTANVFKGNIYKLTITKAPNVLFTDTCATLLGYDSITHPGFAYSFFYTDMDSVYIDSNYTTGSYLGHVNSYLSPCNDTSTTNTTSVNNIATQTAISIYPNPIQDFISVRSSELINKVEITNLIGQNIFTKNCHTDRLTIDMSLFERGMYLIKVNNTFVQKLIK